MLHYKWSSSNSKSSVESLEPPSPVRFWPKVISCQRSRTSEAGWKRTLKWVWGQFLRNWSTSGRRKMPGRKCFGINQKQNCSKQRDQVEMERMLASRPPAPRRPPVPKPKRARHWGLGLVGGPSVSHQSGGPPGTVFRGESPNGAFETFSSIERNISKGHRKIGSASFCSFWVESGKLWIGTSLWSAFLQF